MTFLDNSGIIRNVLQNCHRSLLTDYWKRSRCGWKEYRIWGNHWAAGRWLVLERSCNSPAAEVKCSSPISQSRLCYPTRVWRHRYAHPRVLAFASLAICVATKYSIVSMYQFVANWLADCVLHYREISFFWKHFLPLTKSLRYTFSVNTLRMLSSYRTSFKSSCCFHI